MNLFADLLGVDQRQTLGFFFCGLKDVSEQMVDQRELLYNASVLAHYAQVSTHATTEWPAPADLGAVFDHFVADTGMRQDGAMMEIAGAQCLLLGGFFEKQMQQRHSIRWYSELGTAFFIRAAGTAKIPARARLLTQLANRFEPWRQRHACLARELRERPYLLPNSLPPPP